MTLELPGDPGWPEDARMALADANAFIEELKLDLAIIRDKFTKEARETNRLKAELDRQTAQASHDDEIRLAFDYWVVHCHKDAKRTKLGPARVKALTGIYRLGFSLDDVKLAIDGAARFAYKDGKGTVHNDLELICRNEVKFQRFMVLGERARKLKDYEQGDRDRQQEEDDDA